MLKTHKRFPRTLELVARKKTTRRVYQTADCPGDLMVSSSVPYVYNQTLVTTTVLSALCTGAGGEVVETSQYYLVLLVSLLL